MIPVHSIPTELPALGATNFFMIVQWGGVRKVVHTPHRHAFNELIFIINAGGQHEIDFVNYPIERQTAHFVRAAQVHQINRTDEAMGYSLLFSNDFLLQTPMGLPILKGINELMPIHSQPILSIAASDFSSVEQILIQITQEYQQKPPKWDTIRAYFHVLFTYLQRNKTNNATTKTKPVIHQTIQHFLELIEQHYPHQWTVKQYAAALFISPNYLNELSQQETQQTAHWHIQQRILTEAKRQLCYSDLPIKIIADDLGFDDVAYFARFFKKHTQISPTQYREVTQIR